MFWLWAGFVLLIVLLLAIDLGVFHRQTDQVEMKSAVTWTVVWIALGMGFSAVVYAIYEHHWFGAVLQGSKGGGFEAVLLYVTAYLIEKSLSIDNLFVMAVVFNTFGVEAKYRYRVLFWGIVGALVLRAVMIIGGVWLISRFTWLFYVFGAYLGFTGLKLLRSGEESPDVEGTLFVRVARRVLPIARGHHQGHFTIREDGRRRLTMLALVLLVIEGTDVVFALDSIPAVLAISTDPFIVFTSNIFAILGLRSLYFVLSDMVDRFRYLKKALAAILMFIGAKLVLHSVIKVPTLASLAVIVVVLALGIGISLYADRQHAPPASDGL